MEDDAADAEHRKIDATDDMRPGLATAGSSTSNASSARAAC